MRFGYFDSEIIGVDTEGMPIFDRAETSDMFALLLASLVSTGVLAYPEDNLKTVPGGGMKIKSRPGFAMIKGRFCYEEEDVVFDVSSPDNDTRIDRVVLRLDLVNRRFSHYVKIGVPAFNAEPPELERNENVYEISLSRVKLPTGCTEVTEAMIYDDRPFETVCGYITQLIDHIDVSDIINKMTAEIMTAGGETISSIRYDADTMLSGIRFDADNYLIDLQRMVEQARDLLDEAAVTMLQNQINEIVKKHFDDKYNLIIGSVDITEENGEKIITETTDEAVTVTTFSEENEVKTITTTIIPAEGVAKYICTNTIYEDDEGKHITYTYRMEAK